MEHKMSFEEWFDVFIDKTKSLGYSGPIDKQTFESEYLEGKTPESSADSFVKEMLE